MAKIIINLGKLENPSNVILAIKAYMAKKKSLYLAVVGPKKDVTLLKGEERINTIAVSKDIEDYESFASALASPFNMTSVAFKAYEAWGADAYLSFSPKDKMKKFLPFYGHAFDFVKRPCCVGFLPTRRRPLIVTDWDFVENPDIEDLRYFFDIATLVAKNFNSESDPKIGVFSNSEEGDSSWSMDLIKELKEKKATGYAGNLTYNEAFSGNRFDAAISVGNLGPILAEGGASAILSYKTLFNVLSSRKHPMAGFGASLCKAAFKDADKQLGIQNISCTKFFVGYKELLCNCSSDNFDAVFNAMNVVYSLGLDHIQDEFLKLYGQPERTQESDQSYNSRLESLIAEVEKREN